jgi:PKD repeat protein
MKMKQTIAIALIGVILLSATALAATPTPAVSKTIPKTISKTVPEQKLNASFTVTYSPKKPYTVQLNDTSTGSPKTYSWDFGTSAKAATTKDVTHRYKKAGMYTVTLTVTDAKGQQSKATQVITVPAKTLVKK